MSRDNVDVPSGPTKNEAMQVQESRKAKAALGGVVDDLVTLAEGREAVSVADIRATFGNRSFGPFLLLPALVEISPIGGIPGLPTALALLISLFAVQIAVGRDHLWLPGFVERREIGAERFRKAMEWLRPAARWTDKLIRPRLAWATKRPWLNFFALLCIALAATVPFLEIVPFASTVPMAAIALFGLAVLARDDLVALLAAAVSAGAFYALHTTVIAS